MKYPLGQSRQIVGANGKTYAVSNIKNHEWVAEAQDGALKDCHTAKSLKALCALLGVTPMDSLGRKVPTEVLQSC